MYKVLEIGEKEYRLEYTVEASLYADCVTAIAGFMVDIETAQEQEDVKKILSSMANIPQTALTIFYAGLMEAHGTHKNGDGSVPDIQTAKALIGQYMREHKNNETGNFYGILQMCVEQMQEDGFFEMIGLTTLFQTKGTEETNNAKQGSAKASEK